MRSNRREVPRAFAVIALALGGVMIAAGVSPGAAKYLTKKKALKLFYSKAAADERFIGTEEKAGDADLLDGKDSGQFAAYGANFSSVVGPVTRGGANQSPTGSYADVIDLQSLNDPPSDRRLNLPGSGAFIMTTATLRIATASAVASQVDCGFRVNGPGPTTTYGPQIVVDYPATVNFDQSVALASGVPLAPGGIWDVNVQCKEDFGDLVFIGGSLSVAVMRYPVPA